MAVLGLFGKNEKPIPVDREIEAVLRKMHEKGVSSDEYPTLLKYLERLNDIREKEKPDKVKRDTMWIVGGNLLGILLIVLYEQRHVMSSKGFGQIIHPRIPQ